MKSKIALTVLLFLLFSEIAFSQISYDDIKKDLYDQKIKFFKSNIEWIFQPYEPLDVIVESKKINGINLQLSVYVKTRDIPNVSKLKKCYGIIIMNYQKKDNKYKFIGIDKDNSYFQYNELTQKELTKLLSIEKLWYEFKDYVKKDNRKKVAEFFTYPLHVPYLEFPIKDENVFYNFYIKIINKEMKEAIENCILSYPEAEDFESDLLELDKGDCRMLNEDQHKFIKDDRSYFIVVKTNSKKIKLDFGLEVIYKEE